MVDSIPEVSVIIATYNMGQYLPLAVRSVLAQTRGNLEVHVVDDGSTDDTAEVMRQFARDARVHYHWQPNGGQTKAKNLGIGRARGAFISFCDADDLWTPDKLAVQLAYLQAHPALGYALTYQRFQIEEGTAVPAWVGDGSDTLCHGTSSLAAWRWAIDKIGRFDTARVTGEDSDWLARAVDAGVPGGELRQTLLVRRVHAHNLSSADRRQNRADVFAVLRASIARKRGGA